MIPKAVGLAVTLLTIAPLRAQDAGDAPGPVVAACAAITRVARARFAAAGRAVGLPPSDQGHAVSLPGRPGTCAAHRGGGWALPVEQVTARRRGDRPFAVTGRWGLAFVAPDGAVHPVAAPWLGEALGTSFGDDGTNEFWIRLVAHDLDGDGVPEAIVLRETLVQGQVRREELRVVTWRGGAASPYLPAQGFEDVSNVQDVDHDGRLDLVWWTRFEAPSTCGDLHVGLQAIAHGTERGTFARDDDVARAWLRGQCAEPPARLVVPAGPNDEGANDHLNETLRRVACARVWGATAEEVARRLQAESAAGTGDACLPAAALAAFAQGLRPWTTLAHATLPALGSAPAGLPLQPDSDPEPPPMRMAARALPQPLARGCARVEAQRAAWLARARRSDPPGDPDDIFDVVDGLGGCVAAPGGAWALPLDALRADPIHSLVAGWSIRFLGEDGSVAVGVGDTTPDPSAAEVRGAFDYDGDGRAEVILRPTVWGTDPPEDLERWRVYTARGGAVVPYAPAAAVEVTGVEDVDRDGRPDLLDANTFATPGGCGQGSGFLYGPTLVAHSLADGTFARDDAAARAYARAQCPAPPARLHPGDGPDAFAQTVFNVSCARLWGASAEAVVSQLVAAMREPGSGLEDSCESFRLLATHAVQHPPFVLTSADVPRAR